MKPQAIVGLRERYLVRKGGVTEPGLQANLLAPADDRAEVCDPGGLVCGSSKRQQPHRPQLPAIGRHQRPDLLG